MNTSPQPDKKLQDARACIARKDFATAEKLLQKIVTRNHNLPEPYYLLGIASLQQEKLQEAIAALRQTVKLAPRIFEAQNLLGICLAQLGQHTEACRSFREAVKLAPYSKEATFNLATAYFKSGKLEDSLKAYRQALHATPDNPHIHDTIGQILVLTGLPHEATGFHQRAIALQPYNPEFHFNLGNALLSQGKRTEAAKAYRQAISLRTDYIDAYCALGNALLEKGDPDGALDCYRHARQIDPDHAITLAFEAAAYEKLGRYLEAEELIDRAIATGSDSSHIATAFALISRHIGREDDAIAYLLRILQKPGVSPNSLSHLHFSIARLYDSKRQYTHAFEHYRQANEAIPNTYDQQKLQSSIIATIGFFSPERLSSMPHASKEDRLPIFIVGMPRSGTSLVEQILASHPDIHGAGELENIPNMALQVLPSLLNAPFPACLEHLTQELCDQLSDEYLSFLRSLDPKAKHITDKMPQNHAYIGLIELLFPGARIIHCTRNPLDTCLSCYFQDFGPRLPHTRNLSHLAHAYTLYRQLMAHWNAVSNMPILNVAYEQLVGNIEEETRRLLDFCGLPWNPECLQFHKSDRACKTASYDQVRQPVYTKSVNRWRNYRDFITPLQQIFKDVHIDYD